MKVIKGKFLAKSERGLGGWSAMAVCTAAVGHSVRIEVNWRVSKTRERETESLKKIKKRYDTGTALKQRAS